MSGKPYPAGVRDAIRILADIDSLTAEITDLRRRVDGLKSAEDAYEKAVSKLQGLMESMDIAYSGNAGYAERMRWFLGEMVRQAAGGRP